MIAFLKANGFKVVDGKILHRKKIVTESNLHDILSASIPKNDPIWPEFYQKHYPEEKTKKLLQDFLADHPTEKPVDFSSIVFQEGLPYTYSQVKIFIDQKPTRQSGIIYPSGKVDFWDSRYTQEKLKDELGEAAAQFKASNCITGQKGYFPGNRNLVVIRDDVNYLNTWVEPKWMSCDSPVYVVSKFEEFMNFLFPDSPDRTYMYAWMRDMVDTRAGAAVILAGKPGIGKNLLVEVICQGLVGASNYTAAARGEAKGGRFHAGLDTCRLRLYDELQLDGPTRNDIKGFLNKSATIEKKGVDLEAPKPMYASFVLANNNPSEVVLDFDDRKFFAPRLPEKMLVEEFGQVWIEDFLSEVETPECLKSIYDMCVVRGFGVQSKFPHKTETFNQYCFNSFPLVIKKIVERLKHVPVVDSRDLRTRLEPFEIQKHLEDYRIKFGSPIADFHDRGRGKYIVTRPGYDLDEEFRREV